MNLKKLISGMDRPNGVDTIVESINSSIINRPKIQQTFDNATQIKKHFAPQDQLALDTEKNLVQPDPIKNGIDKIIKAKIRE